MTMVFHSFASFRFRKGEKKEAIAPHRMGAGNRIPSTLKAVFLASNSGKNVDKIQPPPENVASKTFLRDLTSSVTTTARSLQNWKNSFSSTGRNVIMMRQKASRPYIDLKDSFSPLVQVDRVDQINDPTDDVTESGSGITFEVRVHGMNEGSFLFLCASIQFLILQKIIVCIIFNSFQSVIPIISPQEYFDTLISSRGYSTTFYETLKTAYWNKPTELQLASNDVYLNNLVRQRDLKTLRSLVRCGISLNSCNVHGESLLHTICRLGDPEILMLWLVSGGILQVSDDRGRTPLHDACWTPTPCFEVVELILLTDRRMLHMKDARGNTPLNYVRKESWSAWVEFLVCKRDVYWPPRNTAVVGTELHPELTNLPAHSRPVPDPPNALPPRLASLVASGRLSVQEVELIRNDVTVGEHGELLFREDTEYSVAGCTASCYDEDESDDESDDETGDEEGNSDDETGDEEDNSDDEEDNSDDEDDFECFEDLQH